MIQYNAMLHNIAQQNTIQVNVKNYNAIQHSGYNSESCYTLQYTLYNTVYYEAEYLLCGIYRAIQDFIHTLQHIMCNTILYPCNNYKYREICNSTINTWDECSSAVNAR